MAEFIILTKIEAEKLRGAPYTEPPLPISSIAAIDPIELKDGTYLINAKIFENIKNTERINSVTNIRQKEKITHIDESLKITDNE